MAKPDFFNEKTEERLADYRLTDPDRLGPVKAKAAELKKDREKKKAEDREKKKAERDQARKAGKPSKPGKPSLPRPAEILPPLLVEVSKSTTPEIPKSSPTGREILPGRYEKKKKNGTPSRQGERERSELLKNAVKYNFRADKELLRRTRERAAAEGRVASEIINLALEAYLAGKK
jgi:hypothetical protein